VVETSIDPADGRRTPVRAPGHPATVARAAAPVSQALSRTVGDPDPATLTQITAALTMLARRLQPAEPGPLPRALTPDGPDRKGSGARGKENS
jgi:hypothetical protein